MSKVTAKRHRVTKARWGREQAAFKRGVDVAGEQVTKLADARARMILLRAVTITAAASGALAFAAGVALGKVWPW